jgi:hypothetical protein
MHQNYHFIVMLSLMLMDIFNLCWKQQLTISTYIHSAKLLIGSTSLDIPLFFL